MSDNCQNVVWCHQNGAALNAHSPWMVNAGNKIGVRVSTKVATPSNYHSLRWAREGRLFLVYGNLLLENEHYSHLGAKTQVLYSPAAEVKPKWAQA